MTGFNITDCAGSLINHRYVITAAHCLKSDIPLFNLTHVRLGEWDATTNPDVDESYDTGPVKNDPFVDIRIEEIIMHEDYNNVTRHNDIALLRLSTYVNYTSFIKPICLPLKNPLRNLNLDGLTLDVAGWGLLIIVR